MEHAAGVEKMRLQMALNALLSGSVLPSRLTNLPGIGDSFTVGANASPASNRFLNRAGREEYVTAAREVAEEFGTLYFDSYADTRDYMRATGSPNAIAGSPISGSWYRKGIDTTPRRRNSAI
ncbi:hypothetical protein [Paracoccus onubensis]|uniref:Uncharacterized protein n=1 Tax=Paracoccus onubensis TaxID=1675788 RepID=A0A418SPQ5_9RHOB|nr:hypothetical protein [Paracoccus onubensis]RJE82915.1 hypothetical protein D3P04_17915 [Paracoccus onubensis]